MDSREHEHQEGWLSIYATADIYTDESLIHGDADRRGWVSKIDGPDNPVENRNDVEPLFHHELPLDEDALDDLRHVLAAKEWGPHVERGTLYAADSYAWDDSVSEVWNYAIHGHIRHYVDGVMVECEVDPRHPLREGIVRLMAAQALDVDLMDLVWNGNRWEIDGMSWQDWRDGRKAQ